MTQTPPPPSTPSTSAGAPHRGVLVLVLGILSICVCQILGPFAWIMGKGDLAKIESGQMDAEGKGLTQAGMICGIVGTVLLGLWVLYLLFVLLMIILGAGAAAASSP